ncbi:heme ABC transporter ATP-binding protein [Actinosynnema sp. ALI-1.44]|uniref:heme ABC transporter ATP-binding protein n=1 Tax=Actinosynnema sp. ALI-1.44 TaxID=1933779 RepID=UPI00097BB8E0|nr:heme ABC transporter ATP-binding protein [Actinosynnema sp. ALI-1.44]ONI74617.1 heme ABC transporter ATP-binding protein [Actinosynnema sp. ALI-1.44]
MRMGKRIEVPERLEHGKEALRADGVSVRLGGQPVLRDVALQLRAGEVLALVGPNGSGKSTLLSVLAGDVTPDSGGVWIGGRTIADWSTVELARRRAVLPQRITLSFPFTVGEVVRMGRTPWGPDDDEDDKVVDEVMALTETTAFVERDFNSLSGGEQARAALARVLAQRTGIVLLDEPTAALDLKHAESVLAIANQGAAAGDAVLVVLHDLGFAAAHADRIAVLSDGRVVADGQPAEVLTEGLLSEVYQHRVEVFGHPRTGRPVVMPYREG